ncbi:hypothetical protein P261_00592 [Lachnospiraceae bacterium TWA4]|nr:hypothetical protein P261_00592 [Lachnospiraceae bacterium TWA4]
MISNQAFTHGGKFHADDVFSGALLRILNPSIKIIRGFKVPEDFDGIVFDIGLGEFDHHQVDSKVREDGIPYAAFGLLWEKFGPELVGEELAKKFDKTVVCDMDEADNTGKYHAISDLIGSYNPGWDSDKNPDECYEEALGVAKSLLEHKIEALKGLIRAKEEVLALIDTNTPPLLILSRFIPWKQWVVDTPYQFVIYPSNRGGYNAQGVPISEDTVELKCPFPESWRGLSGEELEKVSGICGLRFCHNSGFLLAGETLESVKNGLYQGIRIRNCLIIKKYYATIINKVVDNLVF